MARFLSSLTDKVGSSLRKREIVEVEIFALCAMSLSVAKRLPYIVFIGQLYHAKEHFECSLALKR